MLKRGARPFKTLADVRGYGAFGAADAGMSFTQPGVICDINLIKQLPEAQARRAYCDCAFLEQHSTTELTLGGQVFPQFPELTDTQYDAMLKPIIADAAARGVPYSLRVKVWTSRGRADSNWHKCMTGFCASPDGCYNPDVPEQRDALNVHPLMLYPPWDDVGAAARGIPLRGANFWYTLGQVTTYDASAYDPLDLWKILWVNPALFGLLGLKASLIPFNPQALYFLSGGLGVFPAVVEEIVRRYGVQADWGKLLFETVGKGWLQFGKLLITYLPKCGFGIPGACGVGILLKQAASDQIASGEIDKVLDPTSKAIILFLAKYGDQVVDKLFSLAQMAASARADPSLIALFGSAFKDLSTFPGIDPTVKLAFVLGSKLFDMAYAITVGIRAGKSPLQVGDAAVYALLGFSPMQVIAVGADAGRKITDYATQQSGLDLNQMAALAQQLIPMVQQIITAITDINSKIQGGLEDVILLFRSVEDAVSASAHLGVDAIRAAQNVVLPSAAGRALPATTTGASIMQPQTLVGGAGAARAAIISAGAAKTETVDHSAAGGSGSAALLALSAGGFMVGGPVGALIGLGAALALGKGGSFGSFGAAPPPATSQRQMQLPRGENIRQDVARRTDTSCVGVACPPGQICVNGRCQPTAAAQQAQPIPVPTDAAPPGVIDRTRPTNTTPPPSQAQPTMPQPQPIPVPADTAMRTRPTMIPLRPARTSTTQQQAQASDPNHTIMNVTTGQSRPDPQQISAGVAADAAAAAAQAAQQAAAAAQSVVEDAVGIARTSPGATAAITIGALGVLWLMTRKPRKASLLGNYNYTKRRRRSLRRQERK